MGQTMTGYYSPNPHYAPDDFSEQRERMERCEIEAGRWFADATKEQLARFNERMAVAAAYKGAPRWDREKAAADREWKQTTAAASELLDLTTNELMLTGEVSEALAYRWEELAVVRAMEPA